MQAFAGINALLYLLIIVVNGVNLVSVIYCFMASTLLILSIVDFRTFEIPPACNGFLLVLGLCRVALDLEHWTEYRNGFLAMSIFLGVIFFISGGAVLGGGDVKLMAASGLLLGGDRILLALFIGCVLGAVIHSLRMKISHAGRVLAMGPYLSVGILIAALWGNRFMV